jgi:hypothetical protein
MGADWLPHRYVLIPAMRRMRIALLTAEIRGLLGTLAKLRAGFLGLVATTQGNSGSARLPARAGPAIPSAFFRRPVMLFNSSFEDSPPPAHIRPHLFRPTGRLWYIWAGFLGFRGARSFDQVLFLGITEGTASLQFPSIKRE